MALWLVLPATLTAEPVDQSSIGALHDSITSIEQELETLPAMSFRSGQGAIGYRSAPHPHGENIEWIEIDWGEERPIDQIILVPGLWRSAREGVTSEGFPLQFRILSGDTEIASFRATEIDLPRVAPLILPLKGVTASSIRLDATQLSSRGWDGVYSLELAEILVLDGQENVALHAEVRIPPQSQPYQGGARRKEFLVDGFLPYLMDAAEGQSSQAFLHWLREEETGPYQLTVDLEKPLPLNRIHLHSMEVNDNIPASDPSSYGLPRNLLIEGSHEPEFTNAFELVNARFSSSYDTGPIIFQPFAPTECRYVRLSVLEPYVIPEGHPSRAITLGLAEIELFAEGQNVALEKPFQSNRDNDNDRPLSALTDGQNLYGDILPIRDWLNQLARRHELERKLPELENALELAYAKQERDLLRARTLTAVFAGAVLIAALIAIIFRQRAVMQTRQRIAADLHDELGGNLHAINLLSDLTIEASDDPNTLTDLLHHLRRSVRRTIESARYCTNLIEAKTLDASLAEDFTRASQRILKGFQHELTVNGEESLGRLNPQRRLDFLLFYKECLVNVLRHANATQVDTKLEASDKEIRVTVTDNGKGLPESLRHRTPPSLVRRARLLGGRATADSRLEKGTTIALRAPLNHGSILGSWRRRRLKS